VLGWVLDAFQFFILVFVVDTLAANFHVQKSAIVWSITVTLATRPIGALVFGSFADRFGRRHSLIACVLFFSVCTALTPLAPNYSTFLLLRALYGIGMGGYWGIGASFVVESSPVRWRGLFSGILQAGYPFGYLLAAVALRTVEPYYGWRTMFFAGLGLAAVVVVLTALAVEPAAWRSNQPTGFRQIAAAVASHSKIFVYLVLFMMVFSGLSHGTQDLYPDFLRAVHGFQNAAVSNLAILYNVGAIIGSLYFGHLSERVGRRNGILLALAVCAVALAPWAFGTSMLMLAVGSFVLQFGVQGAFGILPAHLTELSPAGVRSLFPGLVYQLGILLGAPFVSIEFALRRHFGYAAALAIFESAIIIALFIICALGPENRGRDLTA
jgi:MFS transporter, SHS family, lactate transporter